MPKDKEENKEDEKNVTQDELENLENFSDKLRPTVDEFVERRIHHIPFAKTIFWLILQSIKEDFIYSSDLSRYMRLTQTRAYQILNDMVKVGLLKKIGDSVIEFHFIKGEDGKPTINKYLDKAKRTLGIEVSKDICRKK